MNIPTREGERYLCFVVQRRDRGWGGPYGQQRRPIVWRCVECGHRIEGADSWSLRDLAVHHECGHAPCAYCGKPLLRRKDGSPRQRREFAHNITTREYR